MKEAVGGRGKVYVFGSAVKGTYNALSDLDILVVGDIGEEERQRSRRAVFLKTGPHAPIQLHFATPRQFIDALEEA